MVTITEHLERKMEIYLKEGERKLKVYALIPARSGSSRIKDKNIMPLCGHPLMAYTIAVAKQSGIFDRIFVSSDSADYLKIAVEYGAERIIRPFPISDNLSPDIDWVLHALGTMTDKPDIICILRPTNPFRRPETIGRALSQFRTHQGIDSMRCIQKCTEHPMKMWMWDMKQNIITPFAPYENYLDGKVIHGHSSPYQSLPAVYVQNAALEMAWTDKVLKNKSIAGEMVMPFFMPDLEAFDINNPEDAIMAELLLQRGVVELPEVSA